MAVSDYSTSAASNVTISGINIAENCPPSGINDAIRQEMADARQAYNDYPWINYGSGSGTASYVWASGSSFKVPGVDATAIYLPGRRARAVGATTGTIYGTISSASFLTDTTVTVTWDSGALANEALTISIGIPPAALLAPAVPRGWISGLNMSAPGGNQTLTISSGQAADNTSSTLMTLQSSYTKTLTSWSPGSGFGSLDTGTAAANTWYHVYLIRRTDTGATDLLTSINSSNPILPLNYNQYRRIGSSKTDSSSNFLGFKQLGDDFLWSSPIVDVSAVTPNTASRTAASLTVPPGVQVRARIDVEIFSVSGSSAGLIVTSADEADTAPTTANFSILITGISGMVIAQSTEIFIRTNINQQIFYRGALGANPNFLYITTRGWTDIRGK